MRVPSSWLVVRAAGSLLVAGGLAGCGGSADPDAVIGRSADEVSGGAVSRVVVPTGTLTVHVGEPLAGDVAGEDADDLDDHRRPDGTTYVPISWAFDPATRFPGYGVVGQQPQDTSIALRSGGRATRLPAPYHASGPAISTTTPDVFYVPVEDVDAMTLEATYDGLTQQVDLATGTVAPSAATPLYAEAGSETHELDCGDGATVGDRDSTVTLDCEATLQQVPYYPGTGWAEAGRTFDVLGWSVGADRFTGTDGRSSVQSVDATTTVADARSLGELPTTFGSAGVDGRAQRIEVFAAPAGATTATIETTIHPDEGVELAHTITLALPAVS